MPNNLSHRLFCLGRGRCRAELLTLVNRAIGSDGDPDAIERLTAEWDGHRCADALWLPGVGKTTAAAEAEMLEQLALWNQPVALSTHGTALEATTLAAWSSHGMQGYGRRDTTGIRSGLVHQSAGSEASTTQPGRLAAGRRILVGALPGHSELIATAGNPESARSGTRSTGEALLFQQFQDNFAGHRIRDVFEQAEPQWARARVRRGAKRNKKQDGSQLAG